MHLYVYYFTILTSVVKFKANNLFKGAIKVQFKFRRLNTKFQNIYNAQKLNAQLFIIP